MYPRVNYEITQVDLDELLDAMQPVPLIMLNIGGGRSQQERANAAWERLGKKMGFDYMTVQPAPGGNRFFTAVPSETEEQRLARVALEVEEKKRSDISKLEDEIRTLQKKLSDILLTE